VFACAYRYGVGMHRLANWQGGYLSPVRHRTVTAQKKKKPQCGFFFREMCVYPRNGGAVVS